jgi:energy-coupling factor transporter ATP-binding protein EcfA2
MAALKPIKFRVQNFRNIDDSGWIEFQQVTSLVGRNESGKSALLKALHKFNPATPQPYNAQREFPRDRFTAEFRNGEDWPVCSVEFSVADTALSKRLQEIVGSAQPPTIVTFTRYYDGSLKWATVAPALPAETLTYGDVAKAVADFRTAAMKLAPPTAEQEDTYTSIRTDLLNWMTAWGPKWDGNAALREAVGRQLLAQLVAESNTKARAETADIITPFQNELVRLTALAAQEPIVQQVHKALSESLPVFIYFDNYGILDSAVYLPRFLEDAQREPENAKVRTINAMFKHVNLTAQEIADLGHTLVAKAEKENQPVTPEMIAKDQEQMELRRIKLSSASNDITKKFGAWWEQRRHNIRYDADGEFFRIWVSDDKRPGVDIELEERSAGFQWFFSFYLVFLVESEEGHKEAVLLLDEPGLHLHPTAQQELISFFEEISKKNQLVYSTHSPFLIDGDHIERVRPVTEDETGHSRISNDSWPRDRDTIFPLQAAAGYALVKGLFRHKKNLLVEGMSEYFYLMALSLRCHSAGRMGLPEDIYVTPCGGTKLVGILASLFLGQEVRPLILLDADDAGRVRRDALMKELYVGYERGILMLETVLNVADCEIEDLVGEALVVPMVGKVVGKAITLTTEDRKKGAVIDWIKAAAQREGVQLPDGWKAEVARQFAIEWAKGNALPADLLDRAEALFKEIGQRIADIAK